MKSFSSVKVHLYSGLYLTQLIGTEKGIDGHSKAFPCFSCPSEKAGGGGREDEEDCHGFAASLIVQRDTPPQATWSVVSA